MSIDKLCTLDATETYPCQENENLLMRDSNHAYIDINNNGLVDVGDLDVYTGIFFSENHTKTDPNLFRTFTSFISHSCVSTEQLKNYKSCIASIEPSQTLRSEINTKTILNKNDPMTKVKADPSQNKSKTGLSAVGVSGVVLAGIGVVAAIVGMLIGAAATVPLAAVIGLVGCFLFAYDAIW